MSEANQEVTDKEILDYLEDGNLWLAIDSYLYGFYTRYGETPGLTLRGSVKQLILERRNEDANSQGSGKKDRL